MAGQGLALGVVEGQPRAALGVGHVEYRVRPFRLPPGDRAARVVPVPLHQFGVAVDGVEEFVQQVLAHCATPLAFGSLVAASGYQVKYASIVWNRSSESA